MPAIVTNIMSGCGADAISSIISPPVTVSFSPQVLSATRTSGGAN